MSRLPVLCAAIVAAAAAWISQGTIAHSGTGSRLALLPLSFAALALVVLASLATIAIGRRASWAVLALLALVFLPWLPGPIPSAFLLWTGALAAVVWIAAALAVASPRLRLPRITRARTVAAAIAFGLYAVSAWQVSPSIPGGDEPHYLVITQSLLKDGDLKIENNHRRGDYRAFYAGDLPMHFRNRGRDGEVYSIHAPGTSALVLPAFALGGYRGVVIFLLLLSAAGSALAWHLARLVTGRDDAAWFGWAAVTMSATSVFHSFSVYPDTIGALVMLTGVWALLRAGRQAETVGGSWIPWLLHGAALAFFPWLHVRFAALAGTLGAVTLLRISTTPNPAGKAMAFLIVPALSALAWLWHFVALYGTPNPAAPFGTEVASLAFVPGGIAGLLFDQRFGLLTYAPVLLFAFAGLGIMIARRVHRRLALELLFAFIPYLLVVTYVAMWWGGHSAPARFLMPILLVLAIPAAVAWSAISTRATRATALGALAFTAFATSVLVFVDGGRLGYNVREAPAAWLEWLNGAVDLARGLPDWWRDPNAAYGAGVPGLFRDMAIWAALLAAAWWLLRVIERSGRVTSRSTFAAATAGAYAVAAMVATTLVWVTSGSVAVAETTSQLNLLRRIAREENAVAFDPSGLRRVDRDALPAMLRIEPPRSSAPGGAGRNDRPLYAVAGVPAGQYRLRLRAQGSGDAWLMVGIGRDQFSLRTGPIGSPPAPIVLDFPVDVRAIVVRGDDQARQVLRSLVIEPVALVRPDRRLSSDFARRAVRYADATVYFLDERSFPEPEAFWIGGARRSAFVIQPDAARAAAHLLLRNAPVQNTVLVQSGAWREEIVLGAGEERRLDVPLDTERGATLVTVSASSGFQPSAANPQSRDERFLGVWVKLLPF